MNRSCIFPTLFIFFWGGGEEKDDIEIIFSSINAADRIIYAIQKLQ